MILCYDLDGIFLSYHSPQPPIVYIYQISSVAMTTVQEEEANFIASYIPPSSAPRPTSPNVETSVSRNGVLSLVFLFSCRSLFLYLIISG
eukprot:c1747_g1_i1 orf=175-444(-)